jgi:hypothetical protein
MNVIRSVYTFHETFNLKIGSIYQTEDEINRMLPLRERLIREEVMETVHALSSPEWNEKAKIETLDGLADSMYVIAGTHISLSGDKECSYSIPELRETYYRLYLLSIGKEDRMAAASILLRYATICINKINNHKDKPEYTSYSKLYIGELLGIVESIANYLDLDLHSAFQEVHNANMSKRLEDGSFFHDAGGKLRKPPGFVGPDIAYALRVRKPKVRPLYTDVSAIYGNDIEIAKIRICEEHGWTVTTPEQ